MDVQEQACWLLLTFRCGLSVHVVNQIVKSWCQQSNRTLLQFFAADGDERNALCHLGDKVVRKLERVRQSDISASSDDVRFNAMLAEQVAVAKQLANDSIHLLTVLDECYPWLLASMSGENQRPPLLFYMGDLRILERVTIAIIGSRKAGETSLAFTYETAHYLAENGANIISGYARGVDRVAYEGAVSTQGYTTVVLPHGINKLSKVQMYNVLPRIEAGSVLLLSQFHPDAHWLVSRAMERNHVVVALAQVVIVAEANTQGGTWNGAINALEQKRPLYVCQTETSSLLTGNKALIERGGRPLNWSVEDSMKCSYTAGVLSPILQESDMLHQRQSGALPLSHQLSRLLKEQMLVYHNG
jgi:DNA protecting protein DprA